MMDLIVEDFYLSEMPWNTDPEVKVSILLKQYEDDDARCVCVGKMKDPKIYAYNAYSVIRFNYDAILKRLRITCIGELIS